MHALIIEDDVPTVAGVERELRAMGYRSFDIAFSAAEAIAAARARCPDIITADLRLVDGSGVDAVLEICSGRAIPVVFITARADEIRARIPEAVIVEKPLAANGLLAACVAARAAPFSTAERFSGE